MPSGKRAFADLSSSYSGTSQPGGESRAGGPLSGAQGVRGLACLGVQGPAHRRVPGGKEDKEGDKPPSLIYSLSLTFLQVLIMKTQPTAPSRCHNRKLTEYLYKTSERSLF